MTAIEAHATPAPRLEWQSAEVRGIIVETARVKTLLLQVPGWRGHQPGQHLDVRLTADGGYQAERSYSIASPPEDELLAITVEHVEGGEVSPYLAGEIRVGDRFELRGPIGGYFVWTVPRGGPLCLIAGGSGVAPLMAMLRHRDRQSSRAPTMLLYSSRTQQDVIYRQELGAMAARDPSVRIVQTLTRSQPDQWTGYGRRIDRAMLIESGFAHELRPQIYICGPTALVEKSAQLFVELGHDPMAIKTERFGPTGS